MKSCLCKNVGGKKGFALCSDGVGVWSVLTLECSLGELILKVCNVGVPVLLGGSECPVSKGLIILDSMSVDPYETNVESCVLLEVLFLPVVPVVQYTGFRYLGLKYHQFLVKLEYFISL